MSNSTKSVVVNLWPLWIFTTTIFFILKIAGTVAWSWWWVFAPLWIPLSVAGTLVVVVALVAFLLTLLGVDLD